ETAERGERDAAVTRDEGGIEVRGVERLGQPADLVLTHLAEQLRRQAVLLEEREDLGRTVVAGRVVGRAGEAVGADAVGHPAIPPFDRQRGELAEPAGDDGAQLAARRRAQERVALAELAVLVSAAGDERVL